MFRSSGIRSLRLLPLTLAFAACRPDGLSQRNPADFRQSQGVTVCAAGSTVKGIDVSDWQGAINWSQVAGSGIAFAFVRVSDGTQYLDTQFNANWANAKAAGVLRGPYQFFEPGEDATAQANVVINAVGKLGDGDLPVMMDVETATPTAAELTTWLNAVEAGTGKTPVIYSSEGLWNRWFPNGGFASYGLDAANWGASCPALAAGWSSWVFWQYSDNSSIPGIGGNVDGDVYNGSLSALQSYAGADQAPRGYLDSVACDSVAGWSQDLDVPSQAINVDLYFGGPAGSGVPAERVLAGNNRPDLCTAINSCDHGFSTDTPRGLMDGTAHPIHAYGIDANGSDNAELSNSPRTLTCLPTETGVRRHIINPTSYTAWGFSSFQDVRPLTAAEFAGYAQGADWPAEPQLIQGMGDPAVYLMDGVYRRHVVSPTSAGEWHMNLATVQMLPLAQVNAMPQGPDLGERPTLVQGTGPEVDELEAPLPEVDAGSPETTAATDTSSGTSGSSGSSPETSSSSSGGTTGSELGSGSTSGSAHPSTAASSSGSTTGSTVPGHPEGGCTQSSSALQLLSPLAFALLARRRRPQGVIRRIRLPYSSAM